MDDDVCMKYRGHNESLLHVLRDCQYNAHIWRGLVPMNVHQLFFSLSFMEWVYCNLEPKHKFPTRGTMSKIFATVVWWVWKWRSEVVFNKGTMIFSCFILFSIWPRIILWDMLLVGNREEVRETRKHLFHG